MSQFNELKQLGQPWVDLYQEGHMICHIPPLFSEDAINDPGLIKLHLTEQLMMILDDRVEIVGLCVQNLTQQKKLHDLLMKCNNNK